MRFVALIAAGSLAGCSFVLVHGPAKVPAGTDPAKIKCTTSGVIPAIDALAGAAAITAMGGGLILEHASADGKPENFTYYFAAPLLAVAIAYFWAASNGTDDVAACTDVKEKIGQPSRWEVTPIDGPKQIKDKEEPIELDPIDSRSK